MTFAYKPCSIIVRPFEDRKILYAFHDIDGTHSLIRNWPPVMSIVLDYVSRNGVPDGYDSEENALNLIAKAGTEPLPETDRFCVESAGLSALTKARRSLIIRILLNWPLFWKSIHPGCSNSTNVCLTVSAATRILKLPKLIQIVLL